MIYLITKDLILLVFSYRQKRTKNRFHLYDDRPLSILSNVVGIYSVFFDRTHEHIFCKKLWKLFWENPLSYWVKSHKNKIHLHLKTCTWMNPSPCVIHWKGRIQHFLVAKRGVISILNIHNTFLRTADMMCFHFYSKLNFSFPSKQIENYSIKMDFVLK